ncbi:MAG: DUF2244 domain-containing protein [Halieaceae bacterium]|jgi:uncharacterized membrane protein|nr:DUF2244 domain-containing protein [Halieaceae bacterium]
MIIAQPNCSASWRANKLVLLALAIPSLGIATGFAMMGAWPILPLAGLELLAVGSALYYVNWKLQYRHVITLSEDSVRIDKGFYLPRQSWQFPRQGTGLAIVPERHPWDGPALALQRTGESVSVGEFLNRDDSLKLADLLRSEIRVGSHSSPARKTF